MTVELIIVVKILAILDQKVAFQRVRDPRRRLRDASGAPWPVLLANPRMLGMELAPAGRDTTNGS